MKSSSVKIDSGAVAQAADNVRVPHAIECDRFVLKILDQRAFEIGILVTLKQNVKGFDDDIAKSFVGGRQVARHINLGITAAAETVLDVVAIVESALKKL